MKKLRYFVSMFVAAGVLYAPLARAAAPHAMVKPSDVYMQADFSIWSGIHLSKEGKDVGPGFLGLRLADAVHGVPGAEVHAEHAKNAAITAFALGITSLGLIVGSAVYQDQHMGTGETWPRFSSTDKTETWLNIGWLVTLAGSSIAHTLFDYETFQTVNEYNYALMRSVESQFE